MDADLLEQLKVILKKNYGIVCSDSQVLEIGNTLLNYFDILARNKWKLENESRETRKQLAS